MKVWAPQSSYAAGGRNGKDAPRGEAWSLLTEEIERQPSVVALEAWWSGFLMSRGRDTPSAWMEALNEAVSDRRADLILLARQRSLDMACWNAMDRDD